MIEQLGTRNQRYLYNRSMHVPQGERERNKRHWINQVWEIAMPTMLPVRNEKFTLHGQQARGPDETMTSERQQR